MSRLFVGTVVASVIAAFVTIASTGIAQTISKADTIYFGGPILTMNDALPQAEAVAVKDGKIVNVGELGAVEKENKGKQTHVVDLKGHTLMPAFFDAHSHLVLTALKLATVNMDPPPVGAIASIADIEANFAKVLAERPSNTKQWLIGWGYDNAMLAENRHPTRDDLDKISKTVPILLFHFSTHQLVLNTKGLELAGFSASSKDPEGGYIRRRQDSQEPNGIIEETAMLPVLAAVSKSLGEGTSGGDPHEHTPHYGTSGQPVALVQKLIGAALNTYTEKGFTTVTEFGASLKKADILRNMADNGSLPVDVVAAIMYIDADATKISEITSKTYHNRFRVAGGKINLDGGTPGRTAYLREPYFKQLPGEKDYRGYSSIKKQEDLNKLVASFFKVGIPVFIHALGDAAVDQAIAALEHSNKHYPGTGRRTQLIHLQQIQEDQFTKLKKLDTTLSFQVAHNFYFADFHAKEILGPERTAKLNPAQTALKHGFSVTIHHDSPVHPVDQFTLIWAAVNRTGRSGKVWGPGEKISVMDALKASTINAAYQFHEEDMKGSLEKGKLADLIIVDHNPLKIDPMLLKDIKVLETIKDGKTVFKR